VVVNITELDDPAAVATYLLGLGAEDDLAEAGALAEDALDFEHPPAGAWTILAHVAEHEGDYDGFERWTAAALDVDIDFEPSVEDDEYLDVLRAPCVRKASAAVRADHLFAKLEHFSGRGPQMRAQLDLVGAALGTELGGPTPQVIDVAECWLFTGCLFFDAGLLDRFIDHAGAVLPDGELALAQSWRGIRHRHVRQVSGTRRRWTLADIETGEVLEADTLIDQRWAPGREGFVLVVPVGARSVVVGEPIIFDERVQDDARLAVAARADGDRHAVACAALRWRVEVMRLLRIRFCFPDLDPETVDTAELALHELVRSRHPELRARADAGDAAAEADLLLEAIVAERIITRRVLRTWDLVEHLLGLGGTRESVLEAVTSATYAELWDRSQADAA
jgi:hypothetical protein